MLRGYSDAYWTNSVLVNAEAKTSNYAAGRVLL
jgi:hypothetical protein